MVVHKREQVIIVLVKCSILSNQRRGDIPDAPPDSHLQNPAKHSIGWGAGIPEVECAFFQKQLLTLQGLPVVLYCQRGYPGASVLQVGIVATKHPAKAPG